MLEIMCLDCRSEYWTEARTIFFALNSKFTSLQTRIEKTINTKSAHLCPVKNVSPFVLNYSLYWSWFHFYMCFCVWVCWAEIEMFLSCFHGNQYHAEFILKPISLKQIKINDFFCKVNVMLHLGNEDPLVRWWGDV